MEAIGEVINSMKEHWILVLTLTIVVLIYLDYISNYTSLKKLGFKGPTPWPIFGHSMFLIFFGKTFHEYFVTARKKYGKIFGFYLLKTPTVVVMDPEILKSVMVKEFESFHDRPTEGFEMPEPAASMLTTVTGQRWKGIRSVLSPSFTSGKLKSMMYIMNEAGDVLLSKMRKAVEENAVVDIHSWQQSVTIEVILSAAFGIKSESQTNPDDKVTSYAKDAMDPKPYANMIVMIPVIGQWLFKKIALTSIGFNWNPLIKVAESILKKRKEDKSIARNDMLQAMLDAQDSSRKGHILTDNEVIAEMILFMLAGYDTSSNVLALTCYHFAIYPEVQEKAAEEVSRICNSAGEISYDEIKDMHYLDACVSETLRLYPPGFAITRTIDKSCTINGVPFKKGMGVLIPIYALHRDKEFWSEPEAFKPERFLPENKDDIVPFTYMPFGNGPRNCIGMRFAMMEIKTILARILQQYRLLRCPETPVPLKVFPKAVLAPGEPILVRFEKRE